MQSLSRNLDQKALFPDVAAAPLPVHPLCPLEFALWLDSMAVAMHNSMSARAFSSRSSAPQRVTQARPTHLRQASPSKQWGQQQQQQGVGRVHLPNN